MEILLVQLSDIHLTKSNNIVMERIADIGRVLRSAMKEYKACFVVISGDLAYSGKKSEYEVGFDLIANIDQAIRAIPSIATHDFLIVPGNHDCDLNKNDKTRQLVLKSMLVKPDEYDEEMLGQCLKVQDDFAEFEKIVFEGENAGAKNRSVSSRIFNVSGEQVVFDLYNTAWMSKLPDEVGHLLGPPAAMLSNRESVQGYGLRVAVLHHPLHWIKPEASRDLRSALEESADIILTGHEHVQSQYSRAEDGSSGADYIEGGVLQESKAPETSSFNTIEINLIERRFQVTHWNWEKGKYNASKVGEMHDFRRNRKDSTKSFVLSDTFYKNYLKNPGAQFTHPRKDLIGFDDIYTPPDFRRFGQGMKVGNSEAKSVRGGRALEEIGQADKVVISGNEKIGKTSALKSLYWKHYSSGKIPLLISGNSLSNTQPDALIDVVKSNHSGA
ncbi:MAG: metallophosphoesterase [Verrucomicrobiales bacterium]